MEDYSQQVFVGNLPHTCAEVELMDLFTKYGKVVNVRINRKSGQANHTGRCCRDGGKNPSFVSCFVDLEEVVEFNILGAQLWLYRVRAG